MKTKITVPAFLLMAALLFGCSDADSGISPDGGSTTAGLVGSFQVTLVAPVASTGAAGYTQVFGKLFDGPTPLGTIWEQQASEGSCKLLTPRIPFCATPCGGSALCVADGQCQAYPAPVTVGSVKLDGLKTTGGASTMTINPVANNYQPVGVTLAFPPFSEGDPLTLTVASRSLSATTKGIGELKLTNAPITLTDGKAGTLSWTAPGQAALARIKVKVDISHHGGSKGKIECDVEDSGKLVLPATLLDALKKLGVAGFPTVLVTREARATANGASLSLVVSSSVEQLITIPGLVSCNTDKECPSGQTCQTDRRCK